jgi:hypothetical protein
MSLGSLAKEEADYIADWRREYKQTHPGPLRAEEFAQWILDNKDWNAPKQRPLSILTKRIRICFRKERMQDKQGRTVRSILPIKTERIDSAGNQIIDVVYDHIHEMDLHHALLAFSQRDQNINRQKRSASRDLQSALDNNPHLRGHADQFEFGFMVEEPAAQLTEQIGETLIEMPAKSELLKSIGNERRRRNQKSPR